ncbi:phage portal protein [Pseudochrobactrum sp. MP213Fo]|uniref:phage portal protein n=1 Tax=Pseudochrobactrum sp. MP213Fo TaxID=3022250 RepID=UPI003BA20035
MAWTWPWRRNADQINEQKTDSPVSTKMQQGFVALHMDAQARWTTRNYSALAQQGFMRNPIVHRCVKMITDASSTVPWLLYQGETELEEHPLLCLLRHPHETMAGTGFFEQLYGHLLLSGNAYIERLDQDGQPRELHVLRPERVSIESDSNGWPHSLLYRNGASKRQIALHRTAGAGVSASALHLRLFHPLDDYYGFPPLEAALMALDIHNATGAWNKALLDNSARPSGALVYAPKDGGNLSEEQFDRLKTELEEGYTGAGGAGRPLLLEGGLDWKAMGLTPKDMDFIEAKNVASREIALAFGVPSMLLGIPGDNTYANYAEANRAFYRLTKLPLLTRTAQAISNWLCPLYGADLRLEHDYDRIEGLSEERESLWRRIGAADFLSDEEKRQAVGYTFEREG